MNGTGTATLDFGSFPGSNEASVTITGLTGITTTSKVESWLMEDTTTDHTANDHRYFALFSSLSSSIPINDTGFTITAVCSYKLTGTFKVRYVWTT